MKRIIFTLNSRFKGQVQFAIKTVTKGNQYQHIPVVRESRWFSSWVPIVKIFPNEYALLSYEPKGLTIEDCISHIKGYKAQREAELFESYTKTEINVITLSELTR